MLIGYRPSTSRMTSGSANYRELDNGFYMSLNNVVLIQIFFENILT